MSEVIFRRRLFIGSFGGFGLAQALPLDGSRQNSRETPNEMSEMLE